MTPEQKSFEELAPPILRERGWKFLEHIAVWVDERGLCMSTEHAIALCAWEIQQAVLEKIVVCGEIGFRVSFCGKSLDPQGCKARTAISWHELCSDGPDKYFRIRDFIDEPPHTALLRAYAALCMEEKP